MRCDGLAPYTNVGADSLSRGYCCELWTVNCVCRCGHECECAKVIGMYIDNNDSWEKWQIEMIFNRFPTRDAAGHTDSLKQCTHTWRAGLFNWPFLSRRRRVIYDATSPFFSSSTTLSANTKKNQYQYIFTLHFFSLPERLTPIEAAARCFEPSQPQYIPVTIGTISPIKFREESDAPSSLLEENKEREERKKRGYIDCF